MAESKKESCVATALAGVLKSYAERMGIEFTALADAAGIDRAILADGRARIPVIHFERMWRQIVAIGEDPHPGLNFGQEMTRHYPGGSILFTMMMNCVTIGGALDTFVRYHSIMADAIQPQVHQDGDRIRLSWKRSGQGFAMHPDLSEALICTYYSILAHLSQGRLHPICVCFTHARPDDTTAYQRVFNAPIKFAAEKNELIIAADSLNIKIHLADPELYEILETHAARLSDSIAKANEWSDKVVRLMSPMLVKGIQPDIDTISKKLALSRRNLQAKLQGEETTFRNCLATVRKQIALDYLAKPDLSICDVAFLLGYSEQSAFNHAFKRWTGKSPKAYCRDLT